MVDMGVVSPDPVDIGEEIFEEVLAPLVDFHVLEILFAENGVVAVLSADKGTGEGVIHLHVHGVDPGLEAEIMQQVVVEEDLQDVALQSKVDVEVLLPDGEVYEGGPLHDGLYSVGGDRLADEFQVEQFEVGLLGELEELDEDGDSLVVFGG